MLRRRTYPALFWLLRLYWRLVRPTTLGCRCLVLRGDSVLLVRHTYCDGWHLPGGGVKRGEAFAEAARREVREETGLEVDGLRLLQLYHSRAEGKSDHVALFAAESPEGLPRPASLEIAEVCFAPLNALPDDTSPAARRRIAEHLGAAPTALW